MHAFWQAVSSNETLHLKVKLDEAPEQTIKTTSLVIANAAPFTTILAQGKGAPNIKDGLLDVTWIHPQQDITNNVLSLAELALSGLTQQTQPIQSKHAYAKKIVINANHELKYVIDGEVFSSQCLTIEVMQKSLNIFSSEE